ncbi:MAG TPA: uracil-DNA glycosylase [Thermodesulfobacteriota bacterium]
MSGREPSMDALRAEAERLAAGAGGLPAGRLVFGEGNPRAELVIVGEAPGETEARLGRPFVGRAGRLLDDLLAEAGLDRADAWVTNVVKVRPTAGEGPRRRNRPPRVSEVRAWLPVLDAEIAAVDPAVLLGLGAFAGRALVGPEFQMGRDRGRVVVGRHGRPCLVTYHPAYLLRQHGERFAEIRRLAAADLAAVGVRLAELRDARSGGRSSR